MIHKTAHNPPVFTPAVGWFLIQAILTIQATIKEVQPPFRFMPNLFFFLCSTLCFSVFLPWQKQELSSHFSVLAWNSKKGSSKLKKKKKKAETLHLLCFSSNPQQLSSSFFFLLSSLFSFFPVLPFTLSLPRDTGRLNERVRDREMERRNWVGDLETDPPFSPLSVFLIQNSKEKGFSPSFSPLCTAALYSGFIYLFLRFCQCFKQQRKTEKEERTPSFSLYCNRSLSLSISFSPFVCLVFWEKKRKGEQKGSKEQFLMDHLLLFST